MLVFNLLLIFNSLCTHKLCNFTGASSILDLRLCATRKRSRYNSYTPEERAAIGRYCTVHGPSATVRYFRSKFPDMNESSARYMRTRYKESIESQTSELGVTEITEMKKNSRGRKKRQFVL